MKIIKRFLLIIITALLVSCGGTELPPERPSGYITGYAIDSAISGGNVEVYSFANGVRGQRLGGGTTNSTGAFSIKLQDTSQIVLVEVSGGSYVEEASGKTVSLKEDEKLRSLVNYQLENTVSTNISPLTNMATALAEYKIANGVAMDQAIAESFGAVQDFFGIDSRGAASINITTEISSPVTLNEGVLYGFYMAGMSSWTAQASRDNRVSEHTTYTSAGLAKVMYYDVRSDGLLDGQGFNNDNTALVPLAIGNVPLTADEYRLAFSIHMLAMANNVNINKTGLSVPDLSAAAEEIANKTGNNTDLLSAVLPLDIDSRGIDISVQLKDGYSHGNFEFELDVQGILGIDQISILVDGSSAAEANALVGDPLIQPIVIDSTKYSDGPHTITVQVWNALGDPYTDILEFTALFDNTGPQIDLPDLDALTNLADVPLTFTVTSEFAALQSVEATLNGNTLGLTVDGDQRQTMLYLEGGENILTITATDSIGNESLVQTAIFLDQIAPVIDTSAGHGEVQISTGNGDSTPFRVMENDYLLTNPLYLETDYAGFNLYGKVLSRTTLESDGIPYFAFTVSDERNTGVATLAQDLIVSLQYERPGVVLNDWHELPVQPQCQSDANTTITTCEYLIPLLSEILDEPLNDNSWNKTSPEEPHYVRIKLDDGAGNTTDVVEFSFKVDFYVPPMPLCADQSCTQGELVVEDLDPFTQYDGANFADRQFLYNQALGTTQYSFKNPSNKSIYIRLEDDSTHSMEQVVEQELRHHLVEKTDAVQWRVASLVSVGGCPAPEMTLTDPPEINWKIVESVQNYTFANGFVEEFPPAPVIVGTDIPVTTDNVESLFQYTSWQNRAHFDNEYLRIGNIYFDYSDGVQYSYAVDRRDPAVCAEQFYFQQRNAELYQSVDGPRDIVTQNEPIVATLNTNGYTVAVNQNDIQPVSGWFLIPANAIVTVIKKISLADTNPLLVYLEDDFSVAADYVDPSYREISLAWSIDHKINIFAVHDAGEINIGAMSTRDTLSDTGVMTYTINR